MSQRDAQLFAGEPSDPTAPAAKRRIGSTLGSLLSKIALELLIVFVGVTAAFAVEDYRDQRKENERREAIYRALDYELGQMAETHGPVFQRQLTKQLSAWDQAVANGSRPLPPAFRLPGASGPPTGVWDAAAATGSIELVESELFYELGRFYNRTRTVGEIYRSYAESARINIWPRLDEGPSAFWEPDGKLRTETKEHLQRLREFRQRQGALGEEARVLRAKLKRAAKR